MIKTLQCISEKLCELANKEPVLPYYTSCGGAVGDVVASANSVLTQAEVNTILTNLGVGPVDTLHVPWNDTLFPKTASYSGVSGNIWYGYNIDSSKYACGGTVQAKVKFFYTPLADSDPIDTGLDIIFGIADQNLQPMDFISIVSGTTFPPFPTKIVRKLYPAIPAPQQSFEVIYDITGKTELNIFGYAQMLAGDSVRFEGFSVEISAGDFTACETVTAVKECNSSSILSTLKNLIVATQNNAPLTPAAVTVVGENLTSGTGAIPAGLKAVRIKRTTGTVTIGSYTLDAVNPVLDLKATEFDGNSKYLLPAIAPAGGTWQWIALS